MRNKPENKYITRKNDIHIHVQVHNVHAWCILYLVIISDPFMFSGIRPFTDTRVHLLLNRCGLGFEAKEIYYTL